MSGAMSPILWSVATGIGATVFMDALGWLQCVSLGTPAPDYALVGRWLGHLAQGRWRHASIAKASAVSAERAIGWTVHYLTGISFAALLRGLCGAAWVRDPTPLPALAVGLGTVALPFLVMQPAMGLGVAASRTSEPAVRRRRSLLAHLLFGLGLYVAAQAVARVGGMLASG